MDNYFGVATIITDRADILDMQSFRHSQHWNICPYLFLIQFCKPTQILSFKLYNQEKWRLFFEAQRKLSEITGFVLSVIVRQPFTFTFEYLQ